MGYFPDYSHKDFDIIEFSSSKTLLEYDMIIINFKYLIEEYSFDGKYNGIDNLSKISSAKIINDINRRKKEIKELLDSGKNIMIVSPINEFVYRYTGMTSTSGTGRNSKTINHLDKVSLLDVLPQKVETTEGTGNSIECIDNRIKKLFGTYQKNLEYYSFSEIDKCKNVLLKIKGTNKIVSWYEKVGNGVLLFSPNQIFEGIEKENGSKKEKQFLKDIYDFMQALNKSKDRELPNWTKAYRTEEEFRKINDINKVSKEIEKLNKKLEQEKKALDKMEKIKRLFVTDDTDLEEIVKEIFEEFGFETLKFGGVEEDIVMSDKINTFVFEVKGVDGSATEKHTSQTVKWRENYFIDEGIKAKGVLIVNAFKNRELDKRQEPFPKQLLKYSEYQKLCLISTIQLFNIYGEFKKGKIDKNDISSIILNNDGIYDKYNDWNIHLTKKDETL